MAMAYDQFILFGDSITQESGTQERGFGFARALQNGWYIGCSFLFLFVADLILYSDIEQAYIRRLDIVNRGLSGYNTDQAVKVLPTIIPSPEQARIRFLMIFFGANDASLPKARDNQHVPISRYMENLAKIITHPAVVAHKPRIVLVAPPPVNEYLIWISDKAKGYDKPSRTAIGTKSYADAACELGKVLGIPVLNLWSAFMSKTGWSIGEPVPGSLDIAQNSILVDLMHDGLHLNPTGYHILYDELIKLIAEQWPDQLPDNLPYVLPRWNEPSEWASFESS